MQSEITKELQWGETPWDNLTKEELLREVQRMYAALASLHSIIIMDLETGRLLAEHDGRPDPGKSPYWGTGGVGGAALEMCRQIYARLEAQGYDLGENLYRSFYRYARDLLFEPTEYMMVRPCWAVCSECGNMIGSSKGKSENDLIGKPCADRPFGKPDCKGVYRSLIWDDLKPKK